jgi:preprotein translocase subunit SecD
MKAKNIPANRFALWQYLVLAVTIIILAISALPNLYGEHAAVNITSKVRDIHNLDADRLNQALADHQISVRKITTHNDKTTVLLQSTEQQQAAQQHLKTYLGEGYSVAMSMQAAAPNWLTNIGAAPIKLGLDLRGGVQFLLDVDTDVAITDRLEQIKDQAKQQIRQAHVYGAKVRVAGQNKVVIGYPEKDFEKMAEIKRTLKQLYPDLLHKREDASTFSIHFTEQAKATFEREIIKQNLHTLRGRIEELGITEAVTQRQGKNRIRVELPGVQDPTEARRIIGATASLDFYKLKETGGKAFKTEDGRTIKLHKTPVLAGKYIKDARSGVDEMGMPLVNLVLDAQGGKIMTKHSQKFLGKPMVTVFSEYSRNDQGKSIKTSKVINMATIQSVLGSRFSITNMKSPQEAQELALLLRAGSLTAPVTIVGESSIGPSLGQENINNGMAALMLGMGIILAFMALWYRRLGFVANTALVFNLVCLMGLMSLLPGVVLTMPGIAGLVLTVGMAVDTNVLIFERIKEESKKGRSLQSAVEHGYNNAFATILDANITTGITAIILYTVGYGPIKGFAITLGLGLLTSMFTGVFASRAMVNLMLTKSSRLLKGVTA